MMLELADDLGKMADAGQTGVAASAPRILLTGVPVGMADASFPAAVCSQEWK